jgi:hypothetical protein
MEGDETWLWMAGEGQERDGFQISDFRFEDPNREEL